MLEKKIAFIEAPIQCVLLGANHPNPQSLEVFIVRRRGWPVPEELMLKFFSKNPVAVINGVITAIWILVSKRRICSHVTVGSHLGIQNRFLILAGLILNYEVCVLDDGLYGIHFPNWMFFIGRIFKNLHWSSFFFRDPAPERVSSYCLRSIPNSCNYKNTAFLVLSDFSRLGVDSIRESSLIESVKKLSSKSGKQLVILPHRRGRFKLYEDMGLTLLSIESLCFEQWYLDSSFDNCSIIAYNSSIWQVLEDGRIETTLIDLGLNTSDWLLDRNCVESIIQV